MCVPNIIWVGYLYRNLIFILHLELHYSWLIFYPIHYMLSWINVSNCIRLGQVVIVFVLYWQPYISYLSIPIL